MKQKHLSTLSSIYEVATPIKILTAILLIILLLYGCGPATAVPTNTLESASPTTAPATVTLTPSATPQLHVAAPLPAILPADAKPTCTVTPNGAPPFSSWFASGMVTLNGAVNPADSVAFNPQNNCAFYQWSEQMFLWLTSPATDLYPGGGQHVFDSPAFYDVTPADQNGNRALVPHTPNIVLSMAVRDGQNGPHDLPLISDKEGNLFEVLPPEIAGSEKTHVLNDAGQVVEAEQANLVNGDVVFLDKNKNEIPGAKPVIPSGLVNQNILQQFVVDGNIVLKDQNGELVEQGQAGGNAVLEAQKNKSLVYFSIAVNDVYAYFLTGAKTGQIQLGPTPQFPTNATEAAPVIAFATSNGATIQDPNALAVEVKMAWVEATDLPEGSYITTPAIIPVYDMSDPYNWVQIGEEETTLALVGVHVVGSLTNHPEMAWATFEHINNTPLAGYDYINTSDQTVNVSQNTTGDWLFSTDGATGPFNAQRMVAASASSTPVILAVTATPGTPQAPIGPSDTIHWKAWGVPTNAVPNQENASPAESNTEVISINNDVISQLISGDVRANYVMTGSTWTFGGAAPIGSYSQLATPSVMLTPTPGMEIGTSLLTNTSMETYYQGQDSTNSSSNDLNCFACHSGYVGNAGPSNSVFISHIYGSLLPLFGATLTPTPTIPATPTP